jgi:hypothetical protein
MRETTAFFSTCPRCEQGRLQSGYEPIELVESLSAGQAIDAYCLLCDVVWPISAQERFLIAGAITADNPRTRGTGAEQS